MNAVERFLAGDTSDETLAEVRARIHAWLTDDPRGPSLERRLALGTRRSARLARRDAILRAAAATIPGSPWSRATGLAQAVRAFEARRWPRWRIIGVPESAAPIDRLLFAARSLDSIPSTPRQLHTILGDA